MAEGTRMQTMDAAIKHIQEQISALSDAITGITVKLNAMDGRVQQSLNHNEGTNRSEDTTSILHSTSTVPGNNIFRHFRIDFPRFDGSDLDDWVSQANYFFTIHKNVDDRRRLDLASVHMHGHALQWFKQKNNICPFQSWEEFVQLLKDQSMQTRNDVEIITKNSDQEIHVSLLHMSEAICVKDRSQFAVKYLDMISTIDCDKLISYKETNFTCDGRDDFNFIGNSFYGINVFLQNIAAIGGQYVLFQIQGTNIMSEIFPLYLLLYDTNSW